MTVILEIDAWVNLPGIQRTFRMTADMPALPRDGDDIFIGDTTFTVQQCQWVSDSGVFVPHLIGEGRNCDTHDDLDAEAAGLIEDGFELFQEWHAPAHSRLEDCT